MGKEKEKASMITRDSILRRDEHSPRQRWRSGTNMVFGVSSTAIPPRLRGDPAHKKKVQGAPFFVLVQVADAKSAAELGDRPKSVSTLLGGRVCAPGSFWPSFGLGSPKL